MLDWHIIGPGDLIQSDSIYASKLWHLARDACLNCKKTHVHVVTTVINSELFDWPAAKEETKHKHEEELALIWFTV